MSLDISTTQLRRVAFTQLAVFHRCPLEYHERFMRKDAAQQLDRSGLRLYAGQALHRTLARFLTPASSSESPVSAITAVFDRAWPPDAYKDAPGASTLREDLSHSISRYIQQQPHATQVLFIERQITGRFHDFLLVGRIDRADRSPNGGVELIDYKIEDYRREAPGELELQRDFYATAYAAATNTIPEAVAFHFIMSGERLRFACDQDTMAVSATRLRDLLTVMIHMTSFEPHPNPMCRECPVAAERCIHRQDPPRS